MVHPIFPLIFCQNLVEVVALIKSDPGAVNAFTEKHNTVTPLHVASEKGHVELCKVLLTNRANVNSRDSLLGTYGVSFHFSAKATQYNPNTALVPYVFQLNQG